jgi:hypothetical protein
VATATMRPKKLGLPFTHWSIRKLTAYVNGRYGHQDPGLVPAWAVRIGRERMRRILHDHDISFSAPGPGRPPRTRAMTPSWSVSRR